MRRRAWALLLLLALLLGGAIPALADGNGKGNGNGNGNGNGRGHREDPHDADHEDGETGEGDDDEDEKAKAGKKDKDKEKEDKDDDEDDPGEGRRKGRQAGPPRTGAAPDVAVPTGPSVDLHQDLRAVGGRFVYEVEVRNDGQLDAPAVAIAADLPAGGWRSSDPACDVVAGHLSCLIGPLAPGETVVLQARGHLVASPYPTIVQAVTPLGA